MEAVEKKELTSILLDVMLVKLIISYQRKMVELAGNSAWIVSVYVTLIMLIVYFFMVKIYDFSGTILEKAEWIGKKVLKIPIGIILFISLLLTVTSITRLYPESVKIPYATTGISIMNADSMLNKTKRRILFYSRNFFSRRLSNVSYFLISFSFYLRNFFARSFP